jgi:replicative DNA helicase
MSTNDLRVPPHSEDAERSVLGSLLLDPQGITKIADFLSESDFYRQPHRLIYRAIESLAARNQPADLMLVIDELERAENVEAVGGAGYLGLLSHEVPTSVNVRYYAEIVKRNATLRQVIDGAQGLSDLAYARGADADAVVARAQELLFQLAANTDSGNYQHVRDLLGPFVDDLLKRRQEDQSLAGVHTGFTRLDEILGGFQASDLITVAARTGIGKTSFLLNIAWRAAGLHHVPVAVFTLEVSPNQLTQRLLSMQTRIDSTKLRDADLTDEEFGIVGIEAGNLSEVPIYLDDTPALSELQLRSKARRLKLDHHIGLVIVDYLQLMRPHREQENRVQQISQITRALKQLARELNVPVIAGAQLSRAIEMRTQQRPRLSDLRESGSIEQDSDVVIFLYPEGGDLPHSGPVELTIEVAKHRHGQTGIVDAIFVREFGHFLARERTPQY